ncbi:unnamed protein product [Cyprideis torosa]|uniref:Uncharacterized protein n=1 Tax=Cyprideis torosa TaxID=163714 RepID=A0A7R8WKV5_9CRUS|nr:unnamed protein product [Cyprideis torosa]CAG0896519.1 unnamed protein product [Cyprideis torosa]
MELAADISPCCSSSEQEEGDVNIDEVQERDIKAEPVSKLRFAAEQWLKRRRELPVELVYPAKVEGRWLVFWLPPVYSQIYINPRVEPGGRIVSNACTIICVLLCHYLESKTPQPVRMQDGSLNTEYMTTFADIIGEANNIHHYLNNRGILRMVNLTVPEAITASRYRGKNLKEWFFFFDSHSHFEFGSCIGYSPRLDYPTFSVVGNWYAELCTKMAHGREPQALEMTFLYMSVRAYNASSSARVEESLPPKAKSNRNLQTTNV